MQPIDMTETKEARATMGRILEDLGAPRAELTPTRDERRVFDVEYWLEKARDRVSNLAKVYYELDSPINEALLDAENAVEDCIYEYQQAWEISRGREAGVLQAGEDNHNGLPGGPVDR